MYVFQNAQSYRDLSNIVIIQSSQEADHLDDSTDLDSSAVENETPFLESFKSEGYASFAQVKDLHVSVDDPEKHVGGYVSYNVTTKVGITLLCDIKWYR